MDNKNNNENERIPTKSSIWLCLAIGGIILLFMFAFGSAVEWDASLGITFYLLIIIICGLSAFFIYAGISNGINYSRFVKATKVGGEYKPLKDDGFFKWLVIVLIVLMIGMIFIGCHNFFSDIDDGPDYETHYIDENGNGKLDQGEDNYTQDEDGNIVDIDDDHSNFE